MDICRLCLESSCSLESIFIEKEINGECISITKMIALCTGLEISEYESSMPRCLCKTCSNDIYLAFSFRQRCWNSNEILQKHMSFDSYTPVEEFQFPFLEFDENSFNNDDSTTPVEELKFPFLEFNENSFSNDDSINAKENFNDENLFLDDMKNEIIAEHIWPHGCTFCNKSFKKKYDLKLHTRTHTGEKPYTCDLCNLGFIKASDLRAHTRIHTGTTFKCSYCEYDSYLACRLKQHTSRMHPDKIDIFMKTYPAKRIAKTNHICNICNKKFKSNQNLKSHERIHTGVKPYSCKLCNYRSTHLNGLNIHMRTHTGERKFICEQCGVQFRQSGGLINHTASQHTDERPFECPTCLKRFSLKKSLSEHIAIHDSSKKRVCEYCGRKFAKKWALTVHKKWHTGERPHVCEICGKGFIQRHSYRTHMKNNHPNHSLNLE